MKWQWWTGLITAALCHTVTTNQTSKWFKLLHFHFYHVIITKLSPIYRKFNNRQLFAIFKLSSLLKILNETKQYYMHLCKDFLTCVSLHKCKCVHIQPPEGNGGKTKSTSITLNKAVVARRLRKRWIEKVQLINFGERSEKGGKRKTDKERD